MQVKTEKILIIFPGSLGDFIAFLPALKLIRKEYQEANIDIACKSAYACLVEAKPYVANVIERISFALSGLFASPSACTGRTRDYLESRDLIVSYIDDTKGTFSKNLQKNPTGKVISWKGNIRDGLKINIYEHYLNSLELIGIGRRNTEYEINISYAEEWKPAENYFCIHPGSGSKKKNWNMGKFIALAETIEKEYSLSPVFLTGEADGYLRAMVPERFIHLHNETLLKIASVIKGAKFYIGNDSGISHLAGCLRVKSFIIFGPTAPEIWAPPVENVYIIDAGREKDCLEGLGAEKVFEIIGNNV